MSNDTTTDLLISSLFRSNTKNDSKKTVSAKIYRSNKVQDIEQPIFEKQYIDCLGVSIQNLVPDVTNKPRFYVAFDFASTFAVNYTLQKTSKEYAVVKGERLVKDWTIIEAFNQLNDYKNYYYTILNSITGKNVVYEKRGEYNSTSGNALDTQINFINSMLNNFLTSVTINRVCNDVSTCTLSFRDSPNYNKAGNLIHLFSFTGMDIHQQLFIPMVPFTVWARGRIYDQFNIPIFTGYITRVTPTNNQGYTSFTIDGRDSLELARITVENVNPSLLQFAEPTAKELNFYSKVFYGADHFQIVQAMFIGGSLTYDDKGKRVIQLGDPSKKKDLQSGIPRIYPIGSFDSYDEGNPDLTPDTALDKCAYFVDDFSWNAMLQHLRQKKKVICWGYNLTPFKTFGTATPDLYTSNFSNRLEILQNVASTVYHEFYTDGCGNVHYHPMRLSNDFLEYDSFYPEVATINNYEIRSRLKVHKHPLPHCQVVSDHEMINISRTHNVENCVTYLVVHGIPTVDSFTPQSQLIGLIDYKIDNYYLTMYGYRRKDVTIPMFNENPTIKDKNGKDTKLSKGFADAILSYLNGELYTMTASLIFRPELGLALPIYLKELKEVFYIRSISHTIDIGSNASTVINASFGRTRYLPAVDLISYMVKAEAFYLTGEVPIVSELDQVTGLTESINLVLPLTLHSEDMINKYKQIAEAERAAAEAEYSIGITRA